MDLSCARPWNGNPRCTSPSVPASSRPPATILMVEDEALVRVLGVGMLAQAGFREIEAADSDKAIEFRDGFRRAGALYRCKPAGSH
jgi:hypothetical protein